MKCRGFVLYTWMPSCWFSAWIPDWWIAITKDTPTLHSYGLSTKKDISTVQDWKKGRTEGVDTLSGHLHLVLTKILECRRQFCTAVIKRQQCAYRVRGIINCRRTWYNPMKQTSVAHIKTHRLYASVVVYSFYWDISERKDLSMVRHRTVPDGLYMKWFDGRNCHWGIYTPKISAKLWAWSAWIDQWEAW